MNVLRKKEWSPYAAGALLGVVVAISLGLFGHRLSGAGAYQQLSANVGRELSPHSTFFGHVAQRGVTWDILVLVGGLAGAFAASKLAGTFRIRTMPDMQWQDAFGPSVKRRWLIAFVGSMLTEIGAGIAGGCTASLAVSGGALLAPAAFLFMMGMFAGGIPTALAVYRTRGRSGR
jgi:uncharacterized protein